MPASLTWLLAQDWRNIDDTSRYIPRSVRDGAVAATALSSHVCKLESQNTGQKNPPFFKKKKTLSERMFKAWLNFFLLRLRLCCRDRFDVFPSGWRPPSLPSCDAGDRTQLTTFNKLYLLLVGGSLCTCWSVLCALPPPALTCFDPAGPLHIHTGRIKHVQLCLQLFRCSDKYSCCCLMFPPLWWLVVTNKAHNIRH